MGLRNDVSNFLEVWRCYGNVSHPLWPGGQSPVGVVDRRPPHARARTGQVAHGPGGAGRGLLAARVTGPGARRNTTAAASPRPAARASTTTTTHTHTHARARTHSQTTRPKPSPYEHGQLPKPNQLGQPASTPNPTRHHGYHKQGRPRRPAGASTNPRAVTGSIRSPT